MSSEGTSMKQRLAEELGVIGIQEEDSQEKDSSSAATSAEVERGEPRIASVTDDSQGKPAAPAKGSPKEPHSIWREVAPRQDLVGLALSGGGIRSATFNLGLLQRLRSLKLLDQFDFLATVSGGGYIGGFWTAWRTRGAGRGLPAGSFPKPDESGQEAKEIQHLRRFSNFLRPRLQLLSFETGRFLAAVVTGLVPSISAAVVSLALVLLSWLGLAYALTAGAVGTGSAIWAALLLGGLTLSVQAWSEVAWRFKEREEKDARSSGWYWVFAVLACLLTGLLWTVVWHFLPVPAAHLFLPRAAASIAPLALTVLAPSAVWLVVTLFLVFLRTAFSRCDEKLEGRNALGALDRALSRVLLLCGAWTVAAIAWLVGQSIAAQGWRGLVASLGTATVGSGLFTWVRRLLLVVPTTSSKGKMTTLLKPAVLKLLAAITLLAAGAAVASVLAKIGAAFGATGLLAAAAVAFVLLLGVLWRYDPHGASFHSFYRARLVRAFLGASNGDPASATATAECAKDDLLFGDIAVGKPYHLVCCTANDLVGDPLTGLHRGAESAVASRLGLQVGGRCTAWAGSSPQLGSLLTASAAAFNSHMGGRSVVLGRSVTFLLTALNLRLGRWVEAAGSEGFFARLPRKLPGVLYFLELLGLSRSRSPWVFLSDGAHFDNLGLYELVRRHCRYILVSDCGADPEVVFGDLANAVRRVREDFGVEIQLDTAPLVLGEDRRAQQPMVAGEIVYPGGDLGILLYIKPTLTGNEPVDIAQYAKRNDQFPHETTVDQFFDEAQWESYRRLGEHVAESAFENLPPLANVKRGGEPDSPAKVFGHARLAWLPAPVEEPGATHRVDCGWAELEAALWKDGEAGPLRAQVYPPSDGDQPRMSPDDFPKTLPYVRWALRLMEEALLSTSLRTVPSHPRYLGWMNLFGRWGLAPAVQFWWPWIKPLHSLPFVAFFERNFPPSEGQSPEVVARPPTPGGDSFAADRRRGGSSEEMPLRLAFYLESGTQSLQAGLVDWLLKDRPGEMRATWRAEDFFLPQGLWGVGLGEKCLAQLVKYLTQETMVNRLVVECAKSPDPSAMVLYPSAGFHWEPLPGGSANGPGRYVRVVPSTPDAQPEEPQRPGH
jgi:hypothetical protein